MIYMKNLLERCFELYGLSSQLCVRTKPQVILIVTQSRKNCASRVRA